MLANGTHPPPAYPAGHKRAQIKHNSGYNAELMAAATGQVTMSQATAEALLASITVTAATGGTGSGPPTPSVSRQASPGEDFDFDSFEMEGGFANMPLQMS